MTHVLRPATPDDLPAIYQMAKSTGGGFTSLPADRGVLEARLARASEAFRRAEDTAGDDLFFFVLENRVDGGVSGTCQIVSRVGATLPFYSYRIDVVVQDSRELDRRFRIETLTLCNDLDGCSEVGGLYLRAHERSAGVGALLARSRYLFIATHRERFGARVLAELRGVHDEAGGSPFWDGVAGRFFGMSFQEADRFNARNGTHLIAELMPRHPLYRALLPDGALAAIGVPHQSGRAAMRMLEAEGFAYGAYVDVLDGGPTMIAATDTISTISQARRSTVVAVRPIEQGRTSIVAHGVLDRFRAALGTVAEDGDG
ncbi:MAG: arginine N-succinyltransferase, partial [Janthinobacterium lividum]